MTDRLVHSLCRQGFDSIEDFNDHVGVGPSPDFAQRSIKCPVLLAKQQEPKRKHVDNAARQRAYRERKRNGGA